MLSASGVLPIQRSSAIETAMIALHGGDLAGTV